MSTTGVVGSAGAAFEDARIATRAARYDAALELLNGCEDWPETVRDAAICLKAEALGHRDGVATVEWLCAVEDAIATAPGRFAYELAVGKAFANVRDLDSAESHYRTAATLGGGTPNSALTLAAHRARLKWFKREFDPYDADVAASVTHPDPNAAMSALAIRAWHHGSRGNLVAQIVDFRAAYTLFATAAAAGETLDVAAAAITCHSLARVAFETADMEAMADARHWYGLIAWTDDVKVDRFQILRVLGWDSFMSGHPGPAQWAFKDARDHSPSRPWSIMAHLDRAFVARISGNEPWALEEIAEADRLGQTVVWEATNGEERLALLTLAALIAPANASRAQRYASMFSRIGSDTVHPSLAMGFDRRARGFARYAQGRIDAVLGRRDAAVEALREAYELFDGIHYVFQCTMAATALAEVTGENAWRDAAMANAAAYPNCPLVAMIGNDLREETLMPSELSPLQRQIARAMYGGADVLEMSRSLSRSLYTIERQMSEVFAAFGVSSKADFLVAARAAGLV